MCGRKVPTSSLQSTSPLRVLLKTSPMSAREGDCTFDKESEEGTFPRDGTRPQSMSTPLSLSIITNVDTKFVPSASYGARHSSIARFTCVVVVDPVDDTIGAIRFRLHQQPQSLHGCFTDTLCQFSLFHIIRLPSTYP